MQHIKRVQEMEDRFSDVLQAVSVLEVALDTYQGAQKALKELTAYYESPQWIADFDLDSAGEFPKDMKRGVLSEDGVYDLLFRNQALLSQMKSLLEDRSHDL